MAELMEVNASIENASVTFARNSIKENTERIIKKIDFDGNKVFIVKQESCGANLWQMSNSDINKKKPTGSSYFTLNNDGNLKENQQDITQRVENWIKNIVR